MFWTIILGWISKEPDLGCNKEKQSLAENIKISLWMMKNVNIMHCNSTSSICMIIAKNGGYSFSVFSLCIQNFMRYSRAMEQDTIRPDDKPTKGIVKCPVK